MRNRLHGFFIAALQQVAQKRGLYEKNSIRAESSLGKGTD